MKLRSLIVGLVAGALMLQTTSAAPVVSPSDQLGQVEAVAQRGLLTYATKHSIKKKWRFKTSQKCRIKRCFGDPEPPPRSRTAERRPASGGSSPAMMGVSSLDLIATGMA